MLLYVVVIVNLSLTNMRSYIFCAGFKERQGVHGITEGR